MKLESINWAIHHATEHYDRPNLFEDWVCELANREAIASTGLDGNFGMAIQFQMRGNVRVDCPPVDWWLFVFPEGIDWARREGQPPHALVVHACHVPWHVTEGNLMERVWTLAENLGREVEDRRRVSRMAVADAARHPNRIVLGLVAPERTIEEKAPIFSFLSILATAN